MASGNDNIIRGGYWLAEQADNFPPEKILTSNFTHLFYGFAAIDSTTYRLSISENDRKWIKKFMDKISRESPKPKAFLSIGGPKSSGDNDPSTVIANMARNSNRRADFIASTFDLIRPYGFDGLDLAWEFPKTSEEMANIGHLFREWRDEINSRGSNLSLAATVYFSPKIRRGKQLIEYPRRALKDNLDFLNLIAYDYSPSTPAHGQVYVDPESKCTDVGIKLWKKDVSANKLLLGIPLYGHKWELADQGDNEVGAPAVEYQGQVPYRRIPRGIDSTYDKITVSEYLSDGTSWYGFDGPTSIKEKIKYARNIEASGLGGYFLYPLGDDDDQYTLSQAAYDA